MLKRKLVILIVIAVFSIFFDQLTKQLIESGMKPYQSIPVFKEFVRITFVYNKGMAFGLKPQEVLPNLSVTPILTLLMFLASAGLIVYYIFCKDCRLLNLAGISLIIGGAIGNLIDRLTMGKVIDFIDVDINQRLRWPVFNVADSCITIGIGLLLYLALRTRKT